jgi:hypothetical protein
LQDRIEFRRYGLHRVRRFRDDAVGRIGNKEGWSPHPFLASRIVDTANRRFLLTAHGVDYFSRLLCGLLLLQVRFEAEARLGGRRQTGDLAPDVESDHRRRHSVANP